VLSIALYSHLLPPYLTGKGHLAKIIANETKCTLFWPSERFFDGKIERLSALFGIAQETAKHKDPRLCIVVLDECDGLLSADNRGKVNALKQIWENTSKREGVLVILTTNHYDRLKDEGLKTRTDNVITFGPLTSDDKKKLFIRKLNKINHPFELSEADWDELLLKMTNVNAVNIDTICNNVSRRITFEANKGDREDSIIRLADFISQVCSRALYIGYSPPSD
jgi:SpoVK/Ycf46/Vps4 family AAA+-type ATPase